MKSSNAESDEGSCVECGDAVVEGENDSLCYPGLCQACEDAILELFDEAPPLPESEDVAGW